MADDFGDALVAMIPRLQRFARSLARSRERADDLVQTTCEKAIAGRDAFVPGTRLDSWLFRIMRNAWIDAARRDKSRGVEEDIDELVSPPAEDGATVAENALLLTSVAAAIARLPDEQREVMILVCVEDLSYKEAADVLDLPIGTVMSRLSRARLAVAKATGIE